MLGRNREKNHYGKMQRNVQTSRCGIVILPNPLDFSLDFVSLFDDLLTKVSKQSTFYLNDELETLTIRLG